MHRLRLHPVSTMPTSISEIMNDADCVIIQKRVSSLPQVEDMERRASKVVDIFVSYRKLSSSRYGESQPEGFKRLCLLFDSIYISSDNRNRTAIDTAKVSYRDPCSHRQSKGPKRKTPDRTSFYPKNSTSDQPLRRTRNILPALFSQTLAPSHSG